MTANQFRAALARLELTQVGAGRLLGVQDRTIRRWAEDGLTGTAEIVIDLLLAGKITQDDVRLACQRPRTSTGNAPARRK